MLRHNITSFFALIVIISLVVTGCSDDEVNDDIRIRSINDFFSDFPTG